MREERKRFDESWRDKKPKTEREERNTAGIYMCVCVCVSCSGSRVS